MADGGWLGIAMPEEVGGSGLGLTEAAIMMQTVARSGAGFSGCSSIHLNIFGAKPIEKFGTKEQKQEFLPKIISGEQKMCFGVTEPNSGLDTSSLETRAERTNSGYPINGRKIWTTSAQRADKILLIARTTPKDKVAKAYMGLSLFYCDMKGIEAKPIPKMGRKAVECNMLFFDNVQIPKEVADRRRGAGLQIPAAGPQPRARAVRGRSDRSWPCRAGAGGELRQGARRVRPADRPEPGRGASAGEMLGRTRGGRTARLQGRAPLRRRQGMRRRSQRREVSRRRSRLHAPAKRRCWRMAAWATPRNTSSSATSAKR